MSDTQEMAKELIVTINTVQPHSTLLHKVSQNITNLLAELQAVQAEIRDLTAYAKIKASGIHWQLESRKKVVARVTEMTAQRCAEIAENWEDNRRTHENADDYDWTTSNIAVAIREEFKI